MSKRRVVVTGLGWVTSLGDGVKSVWQDLVAGKSGISNITRFDTEEFGIHFAGQVPTDWEASNIEPRASKRLDRFAQYAVNAAVDAVNDAGLDFTSSEELRWRSGSIIGSGIGGIEEFETQHRKLIEKGPRRVSPFMIPRMMCNAGSGNVSIHFGLRGPNTAIATACASAGHAIGDAFNAIRYNQADVMLTGGSEAAVTPIGLACFVALKALSKRNEDPQSASRPFDKDRDGFVLAEGAGILVLEEYEHAKARGATIYAEMLGAGSSADGSHITAPLEDGAGAAYAMKSALNDAEIDAASVNYINAHGTSTGLGDVAETRAIKSVFGDKARDVAISSTKSMTGHLLGASGGIESIISVKAIEEQVAPPTINLDEPDEECDLDYVPKVAREMKIERAMSNSFGFGGHNVSLVFGKKP